ncbi:MAG TPA: isochorismatase family protein [Acidimicrobiales bacterium]|jgi:nicotinamidase/pyrazinamidase|nr:isochorismatase family protein [Acidimicrobiales bacterium]
MADERPTPVPYDATTALIVVDVQNDFVDPGGSLYVAGGEEVPALVNAEVAAALAAGGLVVYTQDWHPPETPHFQTSGGVWPVHCVAGTWGAAFHPQLRVEGPVVQKGTGGEDGYSGFTVEDPRTGARHPTGLQGLLDEAGVTTVIVAGLATDYCVKATALDATANGLRTVVLRRAVRAVDLAPGDGERAFDEMRQAGVALVGDDGEAGGSPWT